MHISLISDGEWTVGASLASLWYKRVDRCVTSIGCKSEVTMKTLILYADVLFPFLFCRPKYPEQISAFSISTDKPRPPN